jgi:hypothetical protein
MFIVRQKRVKSIKGESKKILTITIPSYNYPVTNHLEYLPWRY